MKKIFILIIYMLVLQITVRYLYFISIGKIAPTEEYYYLSKSHRIQANTNGNNEYIWTKSQFMRSELSMIFKRIPIGSIGEHHRFGNYDTSDITLKKYVGLYYFALSLGVFFIFLFDYSLLKRKRIIKEPRTSDNKY